MKKVIIATAVVAAVIALLPSEDTENSTVRPYSDKIFANTNRDIQVAIEPLLNGETVERITPTSYAGLYEVLTPGGILYTDRTGSFVMFGAALVNTKTKINLTAQRLDESSTFEFSKLPFGDAIKTVRGNGSRVIATFEDPNCGYCKRLLKSLNSVENVTVYTFLIAILSPDSATKVKQIWCAPDRSTTWLSYMGTNAVLPTNTNCDTPLERNMALAKKMHVTATPLILFALNDKSLGYLPAEKIEEKIARHSK